MCSDKVAFSDTFIINEDANGGEQLSITTNYYRDKYAKDPIYCGQEITLQSYNNSVSLYLCGQLLTPQILRKLADRIEKNEAALLDHASLS